MHRSKIAILTIVSAFCLFSLTASSSQNQQEESSANSLIEDKGSGGQRKAPKQFEATAIRILSKNKHKKNEDIIVSSSNILSFPLIGKTAYAYNVRDKQQGWHNRITLDEKGQEVDIELLLAEEQAAQLARYGKLDPALSVRLDQSQRQESIPVIINLKVSPGPEEEPQQPDIVDNRTWKQLPEEEKKAFELRDMEYRKKKDEFLMRRTKRIATPLLERLEKLGYKVKTDDYIPIIYANLPPDIIRQVATWDEVAEISLDSTNKPSLEVSRVAIGADIVESRGNGAFAIQVGMVEVGGRIVSTTSQVNPYLSGTIQDTTNVCTAQNDHAAEVAGIIRCTNFQPPGTRGISPGVTIWVGGSCAGTDSQLHDRTSAAVTWGAKVVNHSYERTSDNSYALNAHDNFYDKMVFDRAPRWLW